MTNADFQQHVKPEAPEAIAEQLFAAAGGDHSKALNLWWKLYRPHDVYVALEEKFKALAAVAAKQVHAEAGDDRVLAKQLVDNFPGLKAPHLSDAVREIYRAEDAVAADDIVEACYEEAADDHRLGYQLAIEAAAGNEFIRNRVTAELRNRFVADTTKRLIEAGNHPFRGKRVTYGHGTLGIEADGTLIKGPNLVSTDEEVRAALYRHAAIKIETKTEAGVRAGKTRTRRHEKRLDEITAGLRSGKVYGPATNCVCCKKHLTDEVSIRRGIGPECFEHIQKRLEREAF